MKSLHEVAAAIGQLADVESHMVLTLVLTHVCSHLSLRDPTLDLASLSEPVITVTEGTAAEALGAKVTELVEAFLQATATATEEVETDDDALGNA